MRVRRATRGDLSGVARIENDCFPNDALPMISFVQYFDLFEETFLVAESEGRLAGFAIAGASAASPDAAWVLDIAVAPHARRQGVAQLLLTELLTRLGSRSVRATVSPSNSASLALFARAGFRVERRVPDYFGPGEERNVVLLTR